jgi:hypothetical protein
MSTQHYQAKTGIQVTPSLKPVHHPAAHACVVCRTFEISSYHGCLCFLFSTYHDDVVSFYRHTGKIAWRGHCIHYLRTTFMKVVQKVQYSMTNS